MKGSYTLRYLEDRGLLLKSGQILVLKGFSPYSFNITEKEIPRLDSQTGEKIHLGSGKVAYMSYEDFAEFNKDSLLKKSIAENVQILLVNNIIPYEKITLCADIVSSNYVSDENYEAFGDSLIESQVFGLLSGLINTRPVLNLPQVNFVDPFSIPYQDFSDCDPNIAIRIENEYEIKLSSKGIVDVIFSKTKNEAKEQFCKQNTLSHEEYFNQLLVSLKSTNKSRIFDMVLKKILFLLDRKTLLQQNKTHEIENKKRILTAKLSKELKDLKTEKGSLLKEFPTTNTGIQNRLKFVNLRIEVIENKYSEEFKDLFITEEKEIFLIEEALEYLFLVAIEYLPNLSLSLKDFHPSKVFPINNMVGYSYHIDIYNGLKQASRQMHD